MVNIRMFKDGNSLVVYFDNCSSDIEQLLTNMFKPVMECDGQLEDVEKELADPIVPDGYSLAGKKVSEILQEMGHKGYANVQWLLKKGLLDDADAVKERLNDYLIETFYSVNALDYASELSEEDARIFLQCFDNLVTEDMRNSVKNITGFTDYKTFLREGSYEQIVSVICSVIENIQGR